MTRTILILVLLCASLSASAQTLHGVTDALSGGGSPIVATNFLLADVGSVLLVNTGSKFLVQ